MIGMVKSFIEPRVFDPRFIQVDGNQTHILAASWDNNGTPSFKRDGTKMYMGSNSVTYRSIIQEYDLSTPWDPSTASLLRTKDIDHTTLGLGVGTQFIWGVATSADGTKLYTCDYDGDEHNVKQWTLSTPWNISTLVTTPAVTFNLTGGTTPEHTGLWHDPTGTYFFVAESESGDMVRLKLSTPWNLATATQTNYSTAVSPNPNIGTSLWSDDGKLCWVGITASGYSFYECSTAWDFNTSTLIQSGVGGNGFCISYDGGYTYFCGGSLGYALYTWRTRP